MGDFRAQKGFDGDGQLKLLNDIAAITTADATTLTTALALANANNGIIINATYGEIACSILTSKEKSLSFNLWGIVVANNTPAIVAWIPDLYVKYHMNKPIIKYGIKILTENLFKIKSSI